jgi:hypothetical protein
MYRMVIVYDKATKRWFHARDAMFVDLMTFPKEELNNEEAMAAYVARHGRTINYEKLERELQLDENRRPRHAKGSSADT